MKETETLFGGDEVYMLTNTTPAKMMGFVLRGRDTVVAIDGGTYDDGEELETLLLSLGGRVDTWILTHAHDDHVGAMIWVMERGRVSVGRFIYDFFADKSKNAVYFHSDIEFTVNDKCYRILSETAAEKITPKVGDTLSVGDFTFEFLKAGGGICTDNFNDTSLVFRAKTRGLPILFLGDLGSESGAILLDKLRGTGALRCPVCQLSHHGQGTVGEDFYREVGMKYAFWPTPRWLYEDDFGEGTGHFQMLETRVWMEKLGVKSFTAFDGLLLVR